MTDRKLDMNDLKRLMDAQNSQPNMAEHHVDEQRKAQAMDFLRVMMESKNEFKSVLKMLEELEIEPHIVSLSVDDVPGTDCLVIPLNELIAKEFKAMTGVDVSMLKKGIDQ